MRVRERVVSRLWLRNDGTSYGHYVEQLTYLLFLKMANERSRPPLIGQMSQPSLIPAPYTWLALLAEDGDALFDHYRPTLEELGKQPGTLALIFGKAQNKFQDPARLRRVIVDRTDAGYAAVMPCAQVAMLSASHRSAANERAHD